MTGTPAMTYRPLGRSGLQVSAFGLGTMMFGRWGNPDEGECARMLDAALDAGITLVDTADIYDFGVSESMLGRMLRGRRDRVVLATKCGNAMSDDPLERGLSARWVAQACEDSLRRLDTDHIDLFQMHRPDPSTAADDTVAAFARLIEQGKISAYGTSTFTVGQLDELHAAAARLGVPGPVSEQPPYSALVRGIETEVLPHCRHHGLGVLVWAPLNGGWLTGKYQTDDAAGSDSRAQREPDHFDHRDTEMRTRKRGLVAALQDVAHAAGMSLTELAMRFTITDPAISSALLGPRTPQQLADLLAIPAEPLPADVLAAVDAVVAPGTNVNPNDAS